jgi:hypothetical protein
MTTTWDVWDGLHEMGADEARDEASRLVKKAAREKKHPVRKARLMKRAKRLFREADDAEEAGDGEEEELRQDVLRQIAAAVKAGETDRAERMVEQAEARWGDEWTEHAVARDSDLSEADWRVPPPRERAHLLSSHRSVSDAQRKQFHILSSHRPD